MYFVEIETAGEITEIHSPNANGQKLQAGKITKVLNAVSDFTFSVLPDNPAFAEGAITPHKTLIRVYDEKGNCIFRGRVVDPTYKMDSLGMLVKQFVAEDEMSFLLDSMQHYWEYHDITTRRYLEIILGNHNEYTSGSGIDKQIEAGIITVTKQPDNLYRYLAYESSFQNIKDDLIDKLGGYIRLRYEDGKRYLDYTLDSGASMAMSIRLAENLKSIESQYKPSQIITRLVPLGAEVDSVELALNRLDIAGLLTSFDFWLTNYKSLKWLDQLLINLGKQAYQSTNVNGITTIKPALEFLSEAGVINSPDYWIENYPKFTTPILLTTLIIECAARLDTEQKSLADAAKMRITIADANNGVHYLDDAELIAKYGVIMGAVTWDGVSVPATLKAKGIQWLGTQTLRNSISISAVDLAEIDERYDHFEIGNEYYTENTLLGIKSYYKLVEQTIDVVNPLQSTLTFGDRQIKASTTPKG